VSVAPAPLALAAAAVLGAAGAARAQDTAPRPGGGDPAPAIQAAPVQGAAPVVDGKLGDAAWEHAPVLGGFVQKQPREGEPAAEATEVRFLFDGEALYVGARMHSRDPASLRAPLSRRDNASQAEYLLVSLDTYRDRRTSYTFGVTAAGTRLDRYHPEDDEDSYDSSFDPVWRAAVHRDSAGWTAEMRIPFSQLRFTPRPVQEWGVNVRRWNPATQERSYWVLVPSTGTGWASRFGALEGITGIRPTRRLELMPYVATGAEYTADPGAGNPFDSGSEYSARVGGDVKMGLGPNLTLQGTVNPEFGQVEADPAVVNLSAYETFFDERRPFFVEGSELFGAGEVVSGGSRQYFYSRRIGAAPSGEVVSGVLSEAVDDYEYLDAPDATSILGAAKVTGRLASGVSLGALAAVTDGADVRVFDDSAGNRRVRAAARTGFGVLRAQKELRGNGSTAGLTLVAVERDLDPDAPLAHILPRRAVSGGTDWLLRFRDGQYRVKSSLGFSHVAGDSLSILRLQRASARYYQRPDADPRRYDPSLRSLSGYAASLQVSRNAGSHWLWDVQASAVSPGFELNEAGYLDVADELYAQGVLRYRETRPGRHLRNYEVRLTSLNQWNFERNPTYRGLAAQAQGTLRNYWTVVLGGSTRLRSLSNELTRGGPLMGAGANWRATAYLAGPPAATWGIVAQLNVGGGELGGRLAQLSGTLSFQASPRWRLSASPTLHHEVVDRQFAGSVSGGPEATFGRRYLFAFIDRNTVSLPVRLNYTVTPDLSLEAYVEPFAASGRFHRFGELREARGRGVRRYGTDGTTIVQDGDRGAYTVTDGTAGFTIPYRDFNIHSFRSNAVLRWEWRPGSTLFVVWQQDRYGETATGRPVDVGDLGRTLESAGDNFLVVKLTYWLAAR
jgi:hypothetical protein